MRLTTLWNAILLAVAWTAQDAGAINAELAGEASSALSAFLKTSPLSTRSAAVSTQTPDLASLKAAVIAGNYTSRLSNVTRSRCPISCNSAGTLNSTAWSMYHSLDRLSLCNESMLLDFAVFNPLNDTGTHISIAACTADSDTTASQVSKRSSNVNSTCFADSVNLIENTTSVELGSSGSTSSADVAGVVTALQKLQSLSSQTLGEGSCNETFQFALSGKAAVGFYIGSGLASQGVITSVLESLINQVQSDGTVTENLYVQLCDNRTARYSLGVFANTNADLHSVQQAVQSWRNNTCITENDSTTPNWQEVTFLAPSLLNNTSSTGNNSSKSTNSTTLAARTNFRKLVSRDSTCTTVEVVSGDTCATLAAECGITTDELTDYNPSSDNCTAFTVGESVCCSSGTISQVSNAVEVEGDCEKHLVGNGDLCSTLAAANNITVSDIESYNTDTWGWMGCGDLLIGNYICLSSGYPPMPTTIANAVCGPQVNGTATVPHGTDLSTLNQCPLNACCDIWGQCGTTAEFCTISNSTTGAPGTAAANQNGCISNCGTDIVTSSSPAQIYSIAYYEAFDWQRPCLKMSVDAINTADYTHIHFAFATINADYSLNVSSIVTQLPILSAMNGVKRILSIGGWDFSTNPSTYMIFRDVVASETSRATLITSVVNLLTEYNLDGVDWDWEYPDEPDIPGIPAGSEQDSIGFFLLIDELKASLAASSATSGMTVSITAPASYWYLQYFPIEALSAVVDYIVYMTYDLHGQWDYGRTWSDPGCTEGNCLRSHVNLTETINALSMITKAGVPANTIAVGVSSYGRSFEMTEAGCWTEMCTYAGPDSGALPGPCTDTAGYIADYELELVIAENPTADLLWDENSFSNILVYNGTQWAAYMNDSNKAVRTLLYESLNFLGVSDWAVDLQSNDGSDSSSSTSTSTSSATAYINPDIWTAPTPLVTAPPGEYLIWPPMPLGGTSVFSFDLWYTTISYSSLTTLTSTDSDGGTSTYPWYIYVPIPTVLSIPPVYTDAIPVWAVSIPTDGTSGDIYLTQSIQPSPFNVTITPVMSGTTSIAGATTITDPGSTIVWGTQTYYQPTQTETSGTSTTTIGGITLAPVVVEVTPNPHPTSIATNHDTKLNSRSFSWTSGTEASPTSSPGCDGCGGLCILFCDPDCPSCPPDVFGSDNGGGGSDGSDDNNDGSSTKSETQSSTTTSDSSALYTVLYDTIQAQVLDPTFSAESDLLALYTTQTADWDSLFPLTSTSATATATATQTTSTTKTSTTPTATASYVAGILLFTEDNADSWIFQWWVLDYSASGTTDVCNVSSDIEADADTVAPDPDFPDVNLGPFTSNGFSNCQYTAGKDNTVGTMTCSGVDSITCEKDPQYNTDYSCDGPTLTAVVRCYW